MTLEACLPAHLRGPASTITPIAAGLSGAGVYRVESAGQSYVLKVAGDEEDETAWHAALQIQRRATEAGLSPCLVHVDEARRAVLTDFVQDRSFAAFYRNPSTHEHAVEQLGRLVRRIHALPLPADVRRREPRLFLAQVWSQVVPSLAVPGFVSEAVRRVLAEEPPADDRALVLSHNDLNPSNLIFDGDRILLLDWAAAGPQDADYDPATLAVFLRMDDATSLRLLSAYEGRPVVELPPRFVATRRLVAALAGVMQLFLARQMKHPGATGAETLETTLSLGEFYQQMLAGRLRMGTADGQWAFGLALLKQSLAL